MASIPQYTGVVDSQSLRENFSYGNAQGQLGTASTMVLQGPPQFNGTRVCLSFYVHNTNLTTPRACTLRLVPDGGPDDATTNFFYRGLQPQETFILPLILVKGLQSIKGFSDVSGEVNFFVTYKQEM